MKNRLQNESGFALVACIIISFMLLAAVVEYTRYTHGKSRENQHVVAEQRALLAADAGVHMAVDWLRKAQSSQLDVNSPQTLTSSDPAMTYSVRLVREDIDHSIVDVWSTGSFSLPGVGGLDPGPRQAVIYAQIKQQPIGSYIVASPNTVEITYGTTFNSGNIYAKDIIFDPGTSVPQTSVWGVYYFNSVAPSNPQTFVNFRSGLPVSLTAEPNIPTAAALESDYISMAGADVIPAGSVLTGTKGLPANSYRVYYCPGNLTLGTSSAVFQPTATLLIYAAGNITIGNTIAMDPVTNTLGLLTKGDISISSTTPNTVTLKGITLLADDQFTALGPPRAATLNFTGSMIVTNGISIGNIFMAARNYTYIVPDARLPVPYMTQLTSYKVLSGKYNQ